MGKDEKERTGGERGGRKGRTVINVPRQISQIVSIAPALLRRGSTWSSCLPYKSAAGSSSPSRPPLSPPLPFFILLILPVSLNIRRYALPYEFTYTDVCGVRRLRNVSNFIQTGCEMEESLVAQPGYVTDIPESRTFGKFWLETGRNAASHGASPDNDHFSFCFRSRINKIQRIVRFRDAFIAGFLTFMQTDIFHLYRKWYFNGMNN